MQADAPAALRERYPDRQTPEPGSGYLSVPLLRIRLLVDSELLMYSGSTCTSVSGYSRSALVRSRRTCFR